MNPLTFNFITNLKQMNNKRTLVDLYKDIELVTRVSLFCMHDIVYQKQHKSRDSNAYLFSALFWVQRNEPFNFQFHNQLILVTRVRIFCMTLFTNNNIKVVIPGSRIFFG